MAMEVEVELDNKTTQVMVDSLESFQRSAQIRRLEIISPNCILLGEQY